MRAPVAVLALGLALAVGTPAAWAATRPGPAAGPPVADVLAAPPATPPEPGQPPPAPAPPPAVGVVPPVRLAVPALGVDAPLDAVGVARGGAMALPADVDRVGWYRFGPAPGAPVGTSVLAGHVDDVEQGLGALGPLRTVAPGTEVLVTDTAGQVTRWRVVARELVDKRHVPLDALFRRTGPPRLALITCGGPFLPDVGGYRGNVVVLAEPWS